MTELKKKLQKGYIHSKRVLKMMVYVNQTLILVPLYLMGNQLLTANDHWSPWKTNTSEQLSGMHWSPSLLVPLFERNVEYVDYRFFC